MDFVTSQAGAWLQALPACLMSIKDVQESPISQLMSESSTKDSKPIRVRWRGTMVWIEIVIPICCLNIIVWWMVFLEVISYNWLMFT